MPGQTNERTLIISPNWIGDAIMAQPLLQLLRQQHPGRSIDVLAPAWVAPVWRAMREVETVFEAPFKHGKLQLKDRWRYARMLRLRGYADAYVLPNTLKFALIPWLAGIPKRIGYRGEMRYGLLNVVHHDNPKAPRPMLPFYAALAFPPSHAVPAQIPLPALFVEQDDVRHAMSKFGIAAQQPLIVLAPGAEFGSAKRWPAEYFADLAARIWAQQPDTQIILLGSNKDKNVGDQILERAAQARNLAGITTLGEALALIARATAVVSNDSGLMHIACGLGRPAVVIYGPTDMVHTPPSSPLAKPLSLHLECAPCQQRECPLGHHKCMRDLTPTMVFDALQPMLQQPH